ncbi:hypothetical protein Ancab_015016 [Ancistrocladus abbreviatus]
MAEQRDCSPPENNRYVLKPDVDRPQSLIIEGPSHVGSSYRDFLDKEENAGLKSLTLLNAWFITLDDTPLYQTQTQRGVSSRVMNQALRSVQDLRPAFSSLSRKSLTRGKGRLVILTDGPRDEEAALFRALNSCSGRKAEEVAEDAADGDATEIPVRGPSTTSVQVQADGDEEDGGINMLPDRGVHDDEDSVKPFRPSEAYSNYISMPGLGQAVNQRHTMLIKVSTIHMTGNVHMNVIKNSETVVVELLLMWAYRPTTEFAPSYGDVFKLPSMMDDQHVRIGRFMKHDQMKDYKVLMRRKFNLQAFTKESAGRNRATFDFYLRFRGRNAKYIQFKEGATTGYYSDSRKGACFII